MEHIDIILFALFVVAVISIAFAVFKFIAFTKNYFEQPEDKTGLYDFIKIRNKIINVDSIRVIFITGSTITIELIDSQPIIIICPNDDDANDVFDQLIMSLDPAQIITDEVQ